MAKAGGAASAAAAAGAAAGVAKATEMIDPKQLKLPLNWRTPPGSKSREGLELLAASAASSAPGAEPPQV